MDNKDSDTKKILNLTGHIVRVKMESGKYLDIESSGCIRMASTTIITNYINGIPITTVDFGSGLTLPPPNNNTIYIVSKIVCEACPNRCDFYIPCGKNQTNDGIVRCQSLSKNPYCHE